MKSLLTTVVVLFLSTVAPAAVLFQDDFNTSLAATAQNAAIPNWTVSGGTIDYIKNGGFGLSCLGNTGGCLDMDGSTADAGVLTTTQTFNLLAGVTYEVSYYFSGNQRSQAADSMTVSFGGATNNHTNILATAPYAQFVLTVTPVANTSSQLVFSHAGGDNFGLMLDSVQISDNTGNAVPEPGSSVLLVLGLAGLAFRARRS